ncbi:MAG TPA: dTDP-4-dehydrorhamnose 3,5-epimerase, partial [bacterium]|nr:dTDP-4-dehydrorhamnose 3,5-epimerase [bacterium]
MSFIRTELDGVLIYEPKVFPDGRGYFFESYNQNNFLELGLNYNFVQDNQSKSSYGVLRGLHYQLEPYAQTKLVRVISGKIWDVIVDIRKNSPTYKKWIGMELSEDNFRQVVIPKGFAHGFIVLSDEAVISYKCDNFYNKQSEGGVRFDDPELHIDWKLPSKDILLSD